MIQNRDRIISERENRKVQSDAHERHSFYDFQFFSIKLHFKD